jgi:molecular chaperone Hsp33
VAISAVAEPRAARTVAAMPESTPPNLSDAGLEVRTYFVRSRQTLLAKADFGPLFVDYYLHLADQQIRPDPAHAALFKRALAALVLHAASRPWDEMTAWTLHFQEPLVNLFLSSDNEVGTITGRVLADNVREMEGNFFYADVVRGRQPKRRSSVQFTGADPLEAAKTFYAQSEQRGARFFQLAEEEFALLSEHPDCDLAWFGATTAEQVRELEKTETLVPMETRTYRWHCGCNQSRMLQVLAPAFKDDPTGLFGDAPKIEIRCPRCGARHNVTREAMEAYMAQQKPGSSA